MTKPALLVLEPSDVMFATLTRFLEFENLGFKVLRQRKGLEATVAWSRLRVNVKAILLEAFGEDVIGRAGRSVFIDGFPIQKYPTLLWTTALYSAPSLLTLAGREAILVTANPREFSRLVSGDRDLRVAHYNSVNFKKPLEKDWFYVCSKDELDTVVIKFLRDVLT